MMTWFLTDAKGEDYVLGAAKSWSLYQGLGTPCDHFEIELLWRGSDFGMLECVHRVRVEEDGAVLFRGVIDECEWVWSLGGTLVTITGRGMGALLLDNEVGGVDFSYATLDGILSRYVTPFGVAVGESKSMPGVGGFSVSMGSSAWAVLYEFARYYGGVCPRFDRDGKLLLSQFDDAVVLKIEDAGGLLKMERRYQRYGVLSKVLVVNKTAGVSQALSDEGLLADGFCASSAISVPRGTGRSSMRYTGDFQMEQSKGELLEIVLTLQGSFLAFPGDVVEISLGEELCQGKFRVRSAETKMDLEGHRCELALMALFVIP